MKNRKYLSENYLESIEQPVSETSLIGNLSISNKMKTESLNHIDFMNVDISSNDQ